MDSNGNGSSKDLVAIGGQDTTHKEMDARSDKATAVKEWHGHLRPSVLAVYNAALMTMPSGTREAIVDEMNRIGARFAVTAENMTASELTAMAFGMGAAITSWGAKQDQPIVVLDSISPNLASAFILVQAHQEMAFCLIAELAMGYGAEAGIAAAMSKMPVPVIASKEVN